MKYLFYKPCKTLHKISHPPIDNKYTKQNSLFVDSQKLKINHQDHQELQHFFNVIMN